MTTPQPTPDRDEKKAAPHFRLALSRNQKRRSKLQQVPDESAPPDTKPEPAPEPASPPPAQSVRRTRLKRSGHMHNDLTQPLPEDQPKRESEY